MMKSDRARATGSPGDRAQKLLLIGCSFTFGWGVSDEDTCANCSHPLTADVIVRGDGHPNPRLHSYWADCIAAALRPGV